MSKEGDIVSDEYRGPTSIGHFTMPGRGTSYHMDFEGEHNVQVYITEKRKQIRVFVDHEEWRPQ